MSSALRDWIGQSVEAGDVLDPHKCRLFQAALNLPATASHFHHLPALWHWLFFPSEAPTESLSLDGLPQHDPLLPPIALRSRLWGGSRVRFYQPTTMGELIWRRSEVWDIQDKSSSARRMSIATIRHDYTIDEELVISEERDLVFLDPSDNGMQPKARPAPDQQTAEVSQTIQLNAASLFRYSALSYNTHRLHYDREYCREVEGFRGLVVHGSLTAILLSSLAEKMAGPLASFDVRATAPLFENEPFTLFGRRKGDELSLWAATPDGNLAMTATARPF